MIGAAVLRGSTMSRPAEDGTSGLRECLCVEPDRLMGFELARGRR